MSSIITRYIGPTNTKPARVQAFTDDAKPSTGKRERVTVGYHSVDGCPHEAAALKLARIIWADDIARCTDHAWPRLLLVRVGTATDGRGNVYNRADHCRTISAI